MSIGVNLHHVVRGAITSLHPDETCELYQSIGQRNVKGKVTPVYSAPQEIKANFQPDNDALKHAEAMNDTPLSETVYLYSDSPVPVMGEKRLPMTRTGDILKRSDGTYWLVTTISEDWSWDGWCCINVHQIITPPDFSASDWSDSKCMKR